MSETPSILNALITALKDHEAIKPADKAAVALAKALASRVDAATSAHDDSTLNDLSPKLLAALTALGMTPAARSAAKVATAAPGGPADALAALRERKGMAGA